MYYYSKYNIDFRDGNYVVVVSLMTASIVKFEKDKFLSLKKNRAEESFSQEEIESLLQMSIISSQEDEVSALIERRNDYFKNQDNKRYIITILTTTDCNARCYYCYEHGIEKKKMTLPTADKTVEYILRNYNSRPVHISWFGGEPLYNSEIINQICTSLTKHGVSYTSSITSNAYLVLDNIDTIFTLWNLQNIQITLDAISERYNKIKNYIYTDDTNPFKKVVQSIAILLQNKIKVNLRINYDPRTIEETIKVIKFIHNKFGNDSKLQVYCAPIISPNTPSALEYSNNSSNPILKLYETLIDYRYITKIEDVNIRPRLLNCSIYRKGMAVVDVFGNVYKCQHAIMDGERAAYENVYSNKHDEENIKFWENLEFPYAQCRECKCLPICLGGCKYSAIHNEPSKVCLPIKNCIQQVIELVYKKIFKEDYSC